MAVTPDALTGVAIDTTVEGVSPGLSGVLGMPEGDGPWPAVVVLHELFGVDDEMRAQVAHLATLGYLALMPDLYTAGGTARCLVGTMRALRSGRGRAYADIEAARQWLLGRSDGTGAVGVLGFCMGGGFALMTAASGFDAAAVNYGMLPTDMEVALENACPVVGSFGGKDGTLKGAAGALESTLSRKHIPHDVKEYPEASHVFMNDKLNGPPWIRPLVRVLGFGPNPEAAADAWSRIDAFFRAHLTATRR